MPVRVVLWEGKEPFRRPQFRANQARDLCAELEGRYADFWRTGGSTTIVTDGTFRIDRQGPNTNPPGVRLHVQRQGDSLAAVLIDRNLEEYVGNRAAQAEVEARVIEAFDNSIGQGASGQARYWRVTGYYP
ncbi:hypothetical protein [Nocardiopsis prasina]|uniref:hypothetical protein n=1 Tax=Nocardiopsis prasina TaxID=2015 RepID=UPI0003661DED|nr:hypothetical protein [Nocardiopsis prasina]